MTILINAFGILLFSLLIIFHDGIKDIPDALPDCRIINRSCHFHAAHRISRHKIGRCNVHLFFIPHTKTINSGMFEITSNNGNHPDIFRHARNLWLQAADAPHNQINLYTGLGSLNHLINQDFIRQGTIILIGATTENPYFEVNPALLSRSVIFELKKLSTEDIRTLLLRAVNDTEKGMGSYHAQMDDDALEFLADMANGDARAALTAIELGILTTDRSEDGIIHITLDVASECIQKRVINYDKTGDNHYDTISAFIKSMRGSDPDAAVYYLARMLYAGEDVKFIARRIMILASEDIGNADPQALQVAVAAAQAVERLGMPEARIVLAQAVTYMASAPKSNSAINAIDKAMRVVQETKTPPVPVHLQDAHYKSAGKLGHGKGYKYAHDYENHYVKQQYLPDGLTGEVFYEPSENGYEQQIRAYYKKIKENPEE